MMRTKALPHMIAAALLLPALTLVGALLESGAIADSYSLLAYGLAAALIVVAFTGLRSRKEEVGRAVSVTYWCLLGACFVSGAIALAVSVPAASAVGLWVSLAFQLLLIAGWSVLALTQGRATQEA